MTDLLNTLSSLRAEQFADRAQRGGEDVIVVVARSGDAAAPTRGARHAQKVGNVVHAIRANDEPGAAVVPTADFDKAVEPAQGPDRREVTPAPSSSRLCSRRRGWPCLGLPRAAPGRPLTIVGGASDELNTHARPDERFEPDARADLDRIFDSPVLARALLGVRVESLSNGRRADLRAQRRSARRCRPRT